MSLKERTQKVIKQTYEANCNALIIKRKIRCPINGVLAINTKYIVTASGGDT